MVKAVLDTNVFLSAIFWGGLPLQVLKLATSKKIVGVTSIPILEEVERKLRQKFDYPADKTKQFLELILKEFEIVEPKQKMLIIVEDPTDNKIIEAAIEAKADFIVTGDRHLLKISEYKEIRIVTPKQFLSES